MDNNYRPAREPNFGERSNFEQQFVYKHDVRENIFIIVCFHLCMNISYYFEYQNISFYSFYFRLWLLFAKYPYYLCSINGVLTLSIRVSLIEQMTPFKTTSKFW